MATALLERGDDRLKLAVRFNRGPGRQPLVAAMRRGSADSVLDATLLAVEKAGSAFGAALADIRASQHLTRGAQAEHVHAAAAAFLKAIAPAAKKMQAERERVSAWALSASYVRPYEPGTPFHVVAADIALMQKFSAMQPHEQAALVQQAIHSPATHLRWIEAFLRTPGELSGLTFEERNAMRAEALRVFDAATYAAIDMQTEEIAQTRAALSAAVQMVTEDAPGALSEFRASDPEAAMILQGAGQ